MKLSEIKQINESQFLTDYNEIEKLFGDLYPMSSITINNDGSVDSAYGVELFSQFFTTEGKLKMKFNKVNGNFDCSSLYTMTSMVGCPVEVAGKFDVQGNKITSLEGLPRRCEQCVILNNKITSFEGISDMVDSTEGIYFSGNPIVSGGIGLILIPNLIDLHFDIVTDEPAALAFRIIEEYLGKPEMIYECQAKLIEAELEEYAKI